MGRKRIKAREFIHLCIACLIFSALLGCISLREKEKVEFKKVEVQKEEVRKEETSKILSDPLLQAKRLFEQRDYEGASKENQIVLSLSGKSPPGDEALFNLGLICAHFGNPQKDYGKSIGFFKKLIKDYPQSPWSEQARIWTAVLQENEKLNQTVENLNQVIEKSKKVDIQIEEKKREYAK
jgi:TolA-binding protein